MAEIYPEKKTVAEALDMYMWENDFSEGADGTRNEVLNIALPHTAGEVVAAVTFHSFSKPRIKNLYKYSDVIEQGSPIHVKAQDSAIAGEIDDIASAKNRIPGEGISSRLYRNCCNSM